MTWKERMWQAEVCSPGVPLPEWNSAHGPESLLVIHGVRDVLRGFKPIQGAKVILWTPLSKIIVNLPFFASRT